MILKIQHTITFIIFLLLLLWILIFSDRIFGQTQMGPIRTPQVNTTFYVGQPGHQTIQATVTAACRSNVGTIVIAPGANPSDTPTTVIGGCTGAYIADLRQLPNKFYLWNGSHYILTSPIPGMTFTASGFPNFVQGSELANSPICTEATGCPTQPTSYPPAGIGVSTGSSWEANSINPADVPRLSAANNSFQGTMNLGDTLTLSTGSGFPFQFLVRPGITTPFNFPFIGVDSTNGDLTINPYFPGSLWFQSGGGNGETYFSAPGQQWHTHIADNGDITTKGNFQSSALFVYHSNTVQSAPPNTAVIRSDANGNATFQSTTGTTYLNWDSGNGNVIFGDGHGTGTIIAQLFPSGQFHTIGGIYTEVPVTLANGYDFNAITACGNFSVIDGGNAPTAGWIGIQNICFAPGFYLQIAYRADDWGFGLPFVYFRKGVNFGWGPWYQFQSSPVPANAPIKALPEPTAAEKQAILNRAKSPVPMVIPPETQARPNLTPRSSRDKCVADMWHDDSYLYVCTRNGGIKRAAIGRFGVASK
jgi:hypothetical protein